ncbi:MAG: GNAT family protein [Bacilli bacterium]|jgi:RimJ/RimL family protein N-acetyltransferase
MKNDLTDLVIRQPVKADAGPLLEYLKIIGGESDNLSFGPEGHPNTIEQEETFIEALERSETHLMVVADYGGEIIGDASLFGSPRERLRHSLELGISVKKAYWHMGVATRLLEAIIDRVRALPHVIQITLEVKSDNERAIRLYEKFGFTVTGVRSKRMHIKGVYYDTILMVKPLK